MKSKKFTLILNSHSLSDFQRCEEIYRLNNIVQIEPIKPYYPFARGELLSRIMEIWYKAKKRNLELKKLHKLEFRLMKVAAGSKLLKEGGPDKEDQSLLIAGRLMQYFRKYRNENLKILAVEQGFSKVIYEDNNVYFVYEGRPDLVVDFGGGVGIGPVDHKSESRRSDIYEFNNQFLGYCWATGTKLGMVNYIGLQKEGNEGKKDDVLRRTTFNFTPHQIEKWQNDTIKWFFRAMRTIVSKTYLPSLNCEGKYGVCRFKEVCEQHNDRTKQRIIDRSFKYREEKYKSW